MSESENAASREVGEASVTAAEVEPLRVVLLGRTGTGRSSSGNTILGRSAFWVELSPCSVTTRCRRQTGTVGGRSVSVLDTPGFLHTQMSPQEVMEEVGQCVALSPPGPHVFLVTLRPGRFTQEEREALRWIGARFGPGAGRFTMVLFTWADQLQGKKMEDFLEESPELMEFVSSCHGGYHVFDNSNRDHTKDAPQQVEQLLEKLDKLVRDNRGGCYSNEMLKEAESNLREAQERILGEGKMDSLHERGKNVQRADLERRMKGDEEERQKTKEEEEAEARKRAEKLFWCELVTALGRGAAEGAGIMGKDKGKGKAVKKAKVVERAAALAASPTSITAAAKAMGGAVREGSKVLYKHRKTFLH